jgi:hypothetical protein
MTDLLSGKDSAINTFEARPIYSQEVENFYSEINVTAIVPNELDSLGPRGLYGRVDRIGTPIIPNQTKIIHIEKNRIDHYGFDFVLDAFFDLVNYYDPLASRLGHHKTLKSSTLSQKQLFSQAYQVHIIPVLEKINRKIEQKITDKYGVTFQQYKKLFYSFARSKDLSINPGTFLFSPKFPPVLTCLIIETDRGDFLNDKEKVREFWANNKFSLYVDCARRFGFMVDSFAPWRLYFDLNSAAASYYIQRRAELERVQALINSGTENSTRELNQFLEKFEPANIASIPTVHLDHIFSRYFVELGSQNCLIQDAANAGFSLFV